LNRRDVVWALQRALRFSVGTAVVALISASTLTGVAAERLSTTAYLAATFAAIVLAVSLFVPAREGDEPKPAPHAFPAFLALMIGVAIFLGLSAALASQPGAELLLVVACLSLVVVSILFRSGTLQRVNAVLVRGGFLVAASRYAVAAGVIALLLAVVLPGDASESAAAFAYRFMLLAAVFVAASLLAPTRVGTWTAKSYVLGVRLLDRQAYEFVFERTASYAAIVAGSALIVASFFLPPFSEPFAIAAYGAAVLATFGVAMECRRLRG